MFSISSAGIGEALRRSAAALSAAGNDINQAIGIAVAGNTVIQDPDVVGTMMKTLTMYLRAAKTDAEAAGIETEGMAKSVAKLRDDILAIADVDIMIDDTTFKSTYDILDEISKKWDDILDVDRSNLLNLMGGKRNANVLASIIENFDEARAAVEAAENSAGSATKENEKWLESIEGHLNQLKVTWEEFSQTIMGSGFVKFVIDFLTNTVKLIDSVTKGLGGLGPLVLSILGNGLLNRNKWGFSTAIDGAHQRLTLFGKTIGYAGSQFEALRTSTNAAGKQLGVFGALWRSLTDRMKSGFGGIMTKADIRKNVDLVKSYYSSLTNLQEGQTRTDVYKEWFSSYAKFKDATPEVKKFAKELTTAYAKGRNVNEMIKEFETSQEALRKGSSVWHTIGSGIANIALNLGVTAALNLAIQGIMSAIRKGQEELEQARKAAEKFQETYGSTDETIQKVIKLQAELDSANVTETRAKAIKEELVSVQKELNETYKDEAGYIDLTTNSIEEYIDAIRRKNAEEYANVDYYKQTGGILNTLSQFNDANVILGRRAFSEAGIFEAYDTTVQKTLKEVWNSLNFIENFETFDNGNTKTVTGYTSHFDIFTTEQKLLEGQKKIQEYINDDTLTQSIRENYQKAFNYIAEVRRDYIDKILENQATFEAYIINGDFKDDKTGYSDIYNRLVKAQANYQYKISKAETQEEINLIRKEYEAAIEEEFKGVDSDKDPAVLHFFKTKFEIPESEVKQTEEKIKSRIKALYDDIQAALSDLKTEYETAFSNKSTLQSAYDKIIAGTALTSDEVLKLVDVCSEAFPEISNAFEETAGGYTTSADTLITANEAIVKSAQESLKKTVETYEEIKRAYEKNQEEINRVQSISAMPESAKQEAIKKLDVGISADDYEDASNKVKQFDLVLKMLGVSLDNTSKKGGEFNNVLKTFSSNISTAASAYKEMAKNGTLSASSLESLLSLGDEYIRCIKIENGQIKINVEAFKELSKAKLEDELATVKLAEAEALYNRNVDAMYGGRNHEKLQAILDETSLKRRLLENQLENIDEIWNTAITDTSSGSDNELDKEYEKRYKDLERVNNGTLAAEKKFVSDWIALNEEMYKSADPDKYKENLEKIVDYITGADSKIKAHLESWGRDNGYDENDPESRYAYLNEWITASSVLDNELQQVISDLVQIEGKSNSAIKELEDFNKEFQKTYQLGNVDLTKRPKVATDNGTMTVYSSGQYVWQGDEKNGRYVYVHYTPILDDGTVLSDEEVNRYITNSLTGSGSILDADASGKRIVLKVDTDFELSDDDIKALESGQWTDSLERTTSKLDEWAIGLHEASEEWLELTENVRSANIELAATRKAADAYDNEQLEMAKYEAETMKLEYENGDYGSYQEYADDIRALGGRYRSHDGGNLLDESFFSNIIKAEEQYNAWIADEEKKFSDSIEDRTSLLNATHEELLKHKEGTDNRTKFTTKEFEDNYSKYADDYVALIKKEVEKGIKTNEQAVEEIRKFYEQSELDGADLGSGWLTDQLIDFDSYEQDLDELKKLNNGVWQSEKDFIAKWKALNKSTYGEDDSLFYDPAKYKANIQTIIDYELTELEKAFKKGEISANEYAEAVENALKEKDVLGKDIVDAEFASDKRKDVDKARAEQEKSYWETQKKLVTDYYDTELEKLQKVKDEREKIAKAEELQLNLIKARIELEKAKSQRNQLIFKNGTFVYDYDQEAVMEKQEAVNDAQDAIVANKLDEEIRVLNEQKDAALEYYADIIEMIEAYISETVTITESDSEILNKIKNSEYGQSIRDIQSGKTKANELTEEQLDVTGTKDKTKTKASQAVTTAATVEPISEDETMLKWKDYILQPISKLITEITTLLGSTDSKAYKAYLLGDSANTAQASWSSASNNVDTKTSLVSDNSVNVGDITMTIQGGTSEDMLRQFASKISSAISQATTRAIAQ